MLMELRMILFSTEDKLTALTKWPALPFTSNFYEKECNKFNCWDFELSNNVNTVHVAATLRKLKQQEKVFKYLKSKSQKGTCCHRGSRWVVEEPQEGGWGLEGVLPLSSQKKFENASKNERYFSIFIPLTDVQILLATSVHYTWHMMSPCMFVC